MQNVMAVAPPIEPIMLTLASIVFAPLLYATAQGDFTHASSEAKDYEVDETIDFAQRIREALPVRVQPHSER